MRLPAVLVNHPFLFFSYALLMSSDIAELMNSSIPHTPTSLKILLLESAHKHGDKTAVVALHQPPYLPPGVTTGAHSGLHPHLRWTYSELLDGARLLAAALRHRGVRQGEPIASLLHNSAEWALCFWTAALLGCPWIAIQPRTAADVDELAHVLHLSKPKVILAWDNEQVRQLQASAPRHIEHVPVKIYATPCDDHQTPDGWSVLSSVVAEHSERFGVATDDDRSNAAEDLALVLFTSGTTGRPKGCMHTNKTITNMARNHAHSLGLDHTSASISHLTLAHCFGLLYSLSFWSVGAKVVYPDCTFNAISTLEALELESCTNMPAVPSLLHALLDAAASQRRTKSAQSSLRHIEFSGAMISTQVVAQAQRELGASIVSAHYGMNESGPAAFWPFPAPARSIRPVRQATVAPARRHRPHSRSQAPHRARPRPTEVECPSASHPAGLQPSGRAAGRSGAPRRSTWEWPRLRLYASSRTAGP